MGPNARPQQLAKPGQQHRVIGAARFAVPVLELANAIVEVVPTVNEIFIEFVKAQEFQDFAGLQKNGAFTTDRFYTQKEKKLYPLVMVLNSLVVCH